MLSLIVTEYGRANLNWWSDMKENRETIRVKLDSDTICGPVIAGYQQICHLRNLWKNMYAIIPTLT